MRLIRLMIALLFLNQIFHIDTRVNDIALRLAQLEIDLRVLNILVEDIAKEEKQKFKQEKMEQKEAKKRKYYKKYAKLFNKFNEKYKDIIFHYYYDNRYSVEKDLENSFPLFAREAMLKANGGGIYEQSGYTFMGLPSLAGFNGRSDEHKLSTDLYNVLYFNKKNEENKQKYDVSIDKNSEEARALLKKINKIEKNKKEIQERLTKSEYNYKIHLMPKLDEVAEVTSLLVDALITDVEFGKLISTFKVKSNLDKITHEDVVFPIIVIYPVTGKDKAQKALDKIVELFQDRQGMDLTPRYNAKVTSLIYIAQGNGDDKKDKNLEGNFEQPKMVYYKSDFTGIQKNYYLTFKGENII